MKLVKKSSLPIFLVTGKDFCGSGGRVSKMSNKITPMREGVIKRSSVSLWEM